MDRSGVAPDLPLLVLDGAAPISISRHRRFPRWPYRVSLSTPTIQAPRDITSIALNSAPRLLGSSSTCFKAGTPVPPGNGVRCHRGDSLKKDRDGYSPSLAFSLFLVPQDRGELCCTRANRASTASIAKAWNLSCLRSCFQNPTSMLRFSELDSSPT